MDSMKNIVLQELNEKRSNRKHIDAKIRAAILDNPVTVAQLEHGVELLEEYRAGYYYRSKMLRMAQLENLNMHTVAMDIFTGIAYIQREELFTSVTAQLSSRLNFSDRVEAITTVAEMVAVLCETDAFDITKAGDQGSLMVVSQIELPDNLEEFILNSEYLPPMLCVPLELEHNFSSGYLTHNDSLILGTGNQHDGDLCLDVLNLVNKVPLKLDTQFLSTVEEMPTFELGTQQQENNWRRFKEQSYEFYSLMVEQGNQFYLTNKVDARGRMYCSGYHITAQGTSFKKAMLEFADEEIVGGVE